MTNQYPRLRSHTRRRKNGKVTVYYFYDMRHTGQPDVSLGSDYEQALAKWKELHHDLPRIAGTLEEAFREWERDVLPTYTNKDTRKSYAKHLRFLRPVFGTATWESITLVHLRQYLKRRSAKTQANREMAVLSIIWHWAQLEGKTMAPWPAASLERVRWKNEESPREFEVSDDLFEAVYQAGDQVLRDAMDIASATGMRVKDTIGVLLPAGDLLRLQASKTGKKADFDISLSKVLPDLIERRRMLRGAHHLMLLSTPTGRPVTYTMLRGRWEFAREWAAVNAECAGEEDLAQAIRAMYLRDMRRYASDQAQTDEEASKLLQHSSVAITKKHYRSKVTRLNPGR